VAEWIDLLDPSGDELEEAVPPGLHESDVAQLRAAGAAGRPGLWPHDDHLVGVLIVPVIDAANDDVFYQEVDVVLTAETLLTVRKTTPGRPPYDSAAFGAGIRPGDSVGRCFYRLVDDIADRYLNLVDAFEDEIGELEDGVEEWPSERVRTRVRQIREQILHVRRMLSPLRDAVRGVADGRTDLAGEELFTRDLEQEFLGVYDTLLRAADGLELAHDLLAGARDYYQAKVAQDQNEAVKRLTAIASLLLVPTFIVGLYGQNFVDMPEFHWGIWGYVWSWGLIVTTTLVQLWYFRRRQWF
jgi:magnesium/cobalt transport protein CorA